MSTGGRATELELWSAAVNSAVVRVPGRAFPGVVIQGDSLSILFDLAMLVVEASSKTGNSGLRDAADELARKLFAHVKTYEAVLEGRGVQLPYARDPKREPQVGTLGGGAG